MKPLLLLSLILSASLCATYTAEAKKGSVAVKVNDQVKTLKSDQSINLSAGDIVCFLSGDGRLVIRGDNYQKQLSSHNPSCKQIPIGSSKDSALFKTTRQKIASLFIKSQEQEKSGLSRKSAQIENASVQSITVGSDQQYIEVGSEEWGPLPVTLQIVSLSGEVKATFENSDELISSFTIPVAQVGNQEHLRVLNGFGDVLMDLKIDKTVK